MTPVNCSFDIVIAKKINHVIVVMVDEELNSLIMYFLSRKTRIDLFV